MQESQPRFTGLGKYVDWKRKVFCVYTYLGVDGKPYYVGIGSLRRAYVKHSNVETPSDKDRILVVPATSKQEAVQMELLLISHWGRKSEGGLLLNKTKGGAGLRAPTQEVRRKIAERAKEQVRTPEWSASLIVSNQWRACRDLWIAPNGTVEYTYPREIIRRNPESRLTLRALQRVRNGVHDNHKGWRCVPSISQAPRKVKGQLRVWFHPEHGEVIASNIDLASRYGLNRPHLASMVNGKRKSHKGWVFRTVHLPSIPLLQQPELQCA